MAQAPQKRTPTPAPAESTIDWMSRLAREAFPTINAVRTGIAGQIAPNLAKGDIARAAGNTVGAAVMYPAAAVTDTLAPVGELALKGVPRFVGGLFGSNGDTTVRAMPKVTPTPETVTATDPRQAVAQAMTIGRETKVPTAGDAITSYISNFLQGGATARQAQMLSGLAQTAASSESVKAQGSQKDQLFGKVAAVADETYKANNATIDADVKSGNLTAAQGAIEKAKATDAYFARLAGVLGFDPAKLAQAQLLTENAED